MNILTYLKLRFKGVKFISFKYDGDVDVSHQLYFLHMLFKESIAVSKTLRSVEHTVNNHVFWHKKLPSVVVIPYNCIFPHYRVTISKWEDTDIGSNSATLWYHRSHLQWYLLNYFYDLMNVLQKLGVEPSIDREPLEKFDTKHHKSINEALTDISRNL